MNLFGDCLSVRWLLFFLMCILLGIQNDDWKGKAVNMGHAEYYLDTNHNRQWRWK